MDEKPCVRRHPDITNDTNSLAQQYPKVKQNHRIFENLLRVSLNAEETVTVFPALFFYPKAGGRRLKH